MCKQMINSKYKQITDVIYKQITDVKLNCFCCIEILEII